uniref:SPRY domain-containing SOCS box protein 4-like n=1 Tax=Lepisosteus oculatus TaxID=7918 RepID=W5N7Q6_LEPOC|nr:PREDICTED: SPRY domain-containing SOCS box protein 4-like [Lepisosteus oculatus]
MGLAMSRWLGSPRLKKTDLQSCKSGSRFSRYSTPPPARLAWILDSAPLPVPGSEMGVPSGGDWSPQHCSPNFSVSADRRSVRRRPAECSTDVARGSRGWGSGLHVWEVRWAPGERGSHAVVGIATEHCPLQAPGYTALLGQDAESWGWELGSNELRHGGVLVGQYPHTLGEEEWAPEPPLAVPPTLLVVLDADAGTVGFAVDGHFLGVAFRGLPRRPLYPAVSSVRGDGTVTLRYLAGMSRQPLALTSMCTLRVRQMAGKDKLPLPPRLQRLVQPCSACNQEDSPFSTAKRP